jgi:hypothetical protein
MILTQDNCQLQENSRVTALTRWQVTFRVDIAIARVKAATASRRYALKTPYPRSAISLLVGLHELPRKSERHYALDSIALN